jgi:hypothetical protein
MPMSFLQRGRKATEDKSIESFSRFILSVQLSYCRLAKKVCVDF